MDFISKLAALVPIPRVNLTRYYGIFAPHHAHRAKVVNMTVDNNQTNTQAEDVKHEAAKRARMTWGERLKRVFDIDIKVCEACGGAVKIICVYRRSDCYQSNPLTFETCSSKPSVSSDESRTTHISDVTESASISKIFFGHFVWMAACILVSKKG